MLARKSPPFNLFETLLSIRQPTYHHSRLNPTPGFTGFYTHEVTISYKVPIFATRLYILIPHAQTSQVMDGKSLSPKEENIKQLQTLFPEIVAEGKINWKQLRATLGGYIDTSNERYGLSWAGKSNAFQTLQTPITDTLVPDPEASTNFNTTKNIFIEGENLDVLKVLQRSYFGKVKVIYIDPPYNTGNDAFIYNDHYTENRLQYEKKAGDKDANGYKNP